MPKPNIEKLLTKQRKIIDEVIKKYLPRRLTKRYLEFLVNKKFREQEHSAYNQQLLEQTITTPLWNFLDRGGKRWRPALFLLILEAFGGDLRKSKDFLIIPELIHNGCLTRNTFILKNPGEQLEITKIKEGDYVYTLTSDGKLGRNKVLALKFNGIKEVYRLKTRNREIEASANHPFLVITKEQPKRYKITRGGKEKINTKLKRGDIRKISNSTKRALGVLYNALSPTNIQLLEKYELEFIFNWLGLKLEESDYRMKQTKCEPPQIKLVWKPLRDIRPKDHLIILSQIPDEGKPLKIPNPPKDPVKDKTAIPEYTTEEFCQLAGYVLGDGSISINKKSSRLGLCTSNDKEEMSAYSSIFSKVFGYKLREHRNNPGYLSCCSFKVCWLFDKLGLHKKAIEKTVPDWIFTLPQKQKLAFVRGYLDSDGWVDKYGRTCFSSGSKILIEKLKLLLDSLGFTTSHIHYKKNKNLWEISKKKISEQWSISLLNPKLILERIGTEKMIYKKRLQEIHREQKRESNIYRFIRTFPRLPIDFPNFRIDRVVDIKPAGREPVYDLMIENSNNFIANNIIVHNSLIVDDIEDNSELRRGRSCLHLIFGQDVALNAGNFLYFLPLKVFFKKQGKFPPAVFQKAYETYIQEMVNVSLGQAVDIGWHRDLVSQFSEEEYYEMCRQKTGAMARLAVKLAAIFAGASDKVISKLAKVAEKIAVAFQIQDDLLDIELNGKNRSKFGKDFGNDIKEGKKSLIVIYTLNKARARDKRKLLKILQKHTNDFYQAKTAIEILNKYGAVEYAQQKAKELIKEAKKEIKLILAGRKNCQKIQALMDFLIQRTY